MKDSTLTAVVWKEDVGYVSKCSELGIASAGDTVEEAISNLKEAVELYLENARELGMIDDIRPVVLSQKLTSTISISI